MGLSLATQFEVADFPTPSYSEKVTNRDLADDYLTRARIRIKAILTLEQEGGYADVVRECQELVELILKALLRRAGIEPPHWHDVSSIMQDHRDRFPKINDADLSRLTRLSKALRKERELSFYGDEDYLPTEEYSLEDAQAFRTECEWLLKAVDSWIQAP